MSENSYPSGGVRTLYVRLSRLALDLDDALDPLDGWHLTDDEADLLGLPALHLSIALRRLEQAIHEVRALDQRPRLERLRAAA